MEKRFQMNVKKPNLFIIGAPKSGTTALTYNLSQHSKIFVPKNKEPRFFDRKVFYDYEEDYITKDINEYLNYYKDAKNEKYLVDGSVFNMYSKESIEDILNFSPDAKFIVLIRNPVEASISMFKQRLSYVDEKMREVCEDFNICFSLIKERKQGNSYPKGCRNKFLFRYDLLYSYEKYLPFLKEELKDKLFIGFYDEYKNNPDVFFKKIFNFLDLEFECIENKKYNESFIVKNNFILKSLDFFSKKTIKFRRKVGLIGFSRYKNLLLKKFNKKLEIEADKDIYDFFKPTYEYLQDLREEIESNYSK